MSELPGGNCPFCEEDFKLEGGEFTVEGNKIYQECTCLVYGGVWEDVYTLTSFRVVKDPKGG